jgi:peptide-methionine (R)-S-oxide reductase
MKHFLPEPLMTRRTLFGWLSAFGLLRAAAPAAAAPAAVAASGQAAETPSRLTLDDAQWRARLTPAQYDVLRHEGTERPGSSALNSEKRAGTYRCAGCDLALFSSAMKYDSGTGWPSFFDALPGALQTRTDYRLILPRTEYHCARCGGHHGHVFKDGPKPTGLRYCNNGVALRFEVAA